MRNPDEFAADAVERVRNVLKLKEPLCVRPTSGSLRPFRLATLSYFRDFDHHDANLRGTARSGQTAP